MKDRPGNNMAEVDKTESSLQQAQRAMATGDLERVETLVDHAVQLGDPQPGERRLWVRIAFRQGHIDIALERSEQALEKQPNDPQLRALDARIQAAAGKPRRALHRVNQAIPRWPNSARLRLEKLQLLRDLGRTRPALHVLRQLRRRWPRNPEVLIAVAQFYRAHGRFRATRTVLDHLLEHHPQHRQARVIRQNLANDSTNNQKAASSSLPNLLAQARQQPEVSPADVAELLQAVKLATTSDLVSTCHETIDFLNGMVDQLSEQDKLALFNQAERFGLAEAAHRALAGILATGPRTPPVARTLFQKAMATVEPHQTDAVISHLLRHIPKAKQASLAAEFALRTDGPQSALERLRQDRRQRRSLPEVYNLVRFLRASNDYALGLRYLRFCRRRWPDEAELRLQHARLLMDAGYPETALETLDAPIPTTKRIPCARIRAHNLLEMGLIDAAKEELDKASTYNAANGILDLRLRVLIMLGLEDEATELIQEAKQRGMNNRIASGHFSISLIGNLMNDLALFRRELASLPPGSHDGYLAAHYVHAASAVIKRHFEQPMVHAPDTQQLIPRRVVQYWNDPTPPQSVTDIMHSWASLPNIEYQRFNTQSARFFLRRTFGADYERAFRQANNIAEGADFFRLCYLRHHGGVYADADDRLYGQLDALLPPGVGMVCFHEPFDILANNVIVAAPEHPAIVLASEMAAEALLSRDNDNTWGKTGPGLLTRAVASYLVHAAPDSPAERVAILPSYMLRRQVQIHIQLPHKKTKRHWNATTTTGVDMAPFFTTGSSTPGE
ncbi:glycosyltransferase [Halomonas eurihalina]|nr:glycosyltransferase [Halomonas eurihalina]MDR5858491.1 glycosyltransferase [Halomonas eurihalina]